MKFLKLHCKQLKGPEQVSMTINGTSTVVSMWIVRGKGVQIEYDANGNIVELGVEKKYTGINVHPSYRALVCTDPDGDLIIGVSDVLDED